MQPYQRSADRTLTNRQVTETFGRTPKRGKKKGIYQHRYTSNKTYGKNISGKALSTGYHEVVPTNLYLALKKEQETYNEDKKKRTKKVLKQADGVRTDTAQTVLSTKSNSKVAVSGHPGSKLNEKAKDSAHDALRDTIKKIINNPTEKGLTDKSIAVILGAMAVTSMAPGEYARTIEGGSENLKNQRKKEEWEENRNEAKSRVDLAFEKLLNEDEKKTVRKYNQEFINSIQHDINNSETRKLKRATSYERIPHSDDFNNKKRKRSDGARTLSKEEIHGGRYRSDDSEDILYLPSLSLPENDDDLGVYFTQPFREKRRKTDLKETGQKKTLKKESDRKRRKIDNNVESGFKKISF